MLEALTSNSSGVTRGNVRQKSTNPGGVDVNLPVDLIGMLQNHKLAISSYDQVFFLEWYHVIIQ